MRKRKLKVKTNKQNLEKEVHNLFSNFVRDLGDLNKTIQVDDDGTALEEWLKQFKRANRKGRKKCNG